MASPDLLQAELTLRRQQVGVLGCCLDHIRNGSVAPEPIKIAADAALISAEEIAKQIKALSSP